MSNYLDQPRTFNTALELVPFCSVQFTDMDTGDPTPVYNGLELREDPDNPDEWIYTYSAPLPNPMTSDAAARLPLIFLDNAVSYRMVMTDPDGNVLHDIERFAIFPGPELITPYTDDGELMPAAVLRVFLSQTTQLENEYTADGDGVFEVVPLDDDTAYRVQLKNADGELIYDVDPYPGDSAGIAGGGGCVCDNHALVFFDSSGNRMRWSYVDAINWNCFAPGVYEVSFTAGRFTRAPIVTATSIHDDQPEPGPRVHVEVGEVTASSAMIHVSNLATGDAIDHGVHVHAWEPREIASTG